MDKAQLTIAILTALTPTVAVLLATLIQRQDVRDLRGEVHDLRKDMNELRSGLHRELVSFRDQVHADLLMIHERVAKVEAKQS